MENKELIRSIAEEMAADQYFKEYGPHSTLNDTVNKEKWIEKWMPAAQIAYNKRVKVINHINELTPLMQEQFMRHDYRSMWELWQALRVAVGLSSTENKPDQEAGSNE